ncbi:MAG TPA: hypothetical protein VF429_05530, partial [Anaerolineae bacterium]
MMTRKLLIALIALLVVCLCLTIVGIGSLFLPKSPAVVETIGARLANSTATPTALAAGPLPAET